MKIKSIILTAFIAIAATNGLFAQNKTSSTDSNIFAFLQRNIHECKRHYHRNKNPGYYF